MEGGRGWEPVILAGVSPGNNCYESEHQLKPNSKTFSITIVKAILMEQYQYNLT